MKKTEANFGLKINGRNLLFYIFWTILLIGKGFGMSSANPTMVTMTWIAMPFVALKLGSEQYKKNEFVKMIFLIMTGLGVYVKTKDAAVLLTALAICATKGIDLYEIFRYSFWMKAILFVLRTTLAILGVLNIQAMVRFDSGNIHTVRYGLGYEQPNATHYTLFVTIVLLFLSYKKLKIWHYIALETYNFYIFRYTDSRTGFIVTTLLILLVFLNRKGMLKDVFWDIQRKTSYIYIALSGASILIPFFLPYITKLSGVGTFLSRFRTATNVLSNYGLSFFGQSNISTDSGYINTLFSYGLVFFVAFIWMNTRLMRIFSKEEFKEEHIIFLAYAIYTLMEAYSASILMNASLIFFSLLLFDENMECYIQYELN